MMIIDFRNRPPYASIAQSILYDRSRREKMAPRFGMHLAPSVLDKSMVLWERELAEAGIDRAVALIRRATGMRNDDLADLIAAYPEKVIGLVGIDPEEGEEALEDIDRYVLGGLAAGIVMELGKCRTPLMADDERLYPLYEKCQAAHISVTLGFGGFVAPNYPYFDPMSIWRLTRDFPDLSVILAHGGWPYVNEICHVAYQRPKLYLSPDIYAMNIPGADGYIAAANYLLPDQIIFGSAYPIVSMQEAVAYYRNRLSAEAFPKVMGLNALRALGLPSVDSGVKA